MSMHDHWDQAYEMGRNAGIEDALALMQDSLTVEDAIKGVELLLSDGEPISYGSDIKSNVIAIRSLQTEISTALRESLN